ncbi:MAG TPA: RNA 2',3'-cyclic phosphodiesterase [Thermomicrobiales bacterium]|nr:RNA 2',3'-cyclic phosphodiesterase [Thermomicrobiales bacterium]
MARRNRPQSNPRPERPQAKPEGPRLFIAAPLPNAVLDHLGHLLDDLSSRDLPVRWTAQNALHLTLHFIGEVPTERAELLRMSFANLSPKSGSIRLRTGNLGVFPNQKRPRVLWIGLTGQTDRLTKLYRDTGTMLDRFGVSIEEQSFRPHLTLGRARDSVDRLFPYQLGEAYHAPSVQEIVDHPVEFTISELTLFRSHLEKSGARYESLATIRLAKPGTE